MAAQANILGHLLKNLPNKTLNGACMLGEGGLVEREQERGSSWLFITEGLGKGMGVALESWNQGSKVLDLLLGPHLLPVQLTVLMLLGKVQQRAHNSH